MRIQLVQGEIEEALADFIVKQGINLAGKDLQISFTNGRGNNGVTADLDIEPSQEGRPNRSTVLHAVESTPAPVVTETKPEPKVEVVHTDKAAPVVEDEPKLIDPPFDTDSLEEAESMVEAAPKKDAISLFS
jgi:hypothetical protein